MTRTDSVLARVCAALVLVAGAAIQRSAGQTAPPNWPQLATELHPAESFADIAHSQARSIALFEEAAKVLQHPRCMNCHPADTYSYGHGSQGPAGHPPLEAMPNSANC